MTNRRNLFQSCPSALCFVDLPLKSSLKISNLKANLKEYISIHRKIENYILYIMYLLRRKITDYYHCKKIDII